MTDKLDLRTETDNKRRVEALAYDKCITNRPPQSGELVIALCGANEVPRHIENFTSRGILEKDIILVENDPGAYQKMKQVVAREGFQCTVVFGDVYDYAETISKSRAIYLLDADSTEMPSLPRFEFLSNWVTEKKSIHTLFTTCQRMNPVSKKEVIQMADNLQIPRITKAVNKRTAQFTERERDYDTRAKREGRTPTGHKEPKDNQLPVFRVICEAWLKSLDVAQAYCDSYRGGGSTKKNAFGPPMITLVMSV